MRVQNGQIIDTDYLKIDTDNDGLEDGQEIMPVYKKKTIPQSITGAEKIVGITFVMNSNPKNNDDTDDDGYCDIEDPEPNNKPDYLGDKYDFLDGETYYISGNVNYFLDIKNGATTDGTPAIMHSFNGNDSQKFKFEWYGTSYKIHELNNTNLILTMETDSSGSYKLTMKIDADQQNQMWEVLPYDTDLDDSEHYYGLVIRSKALHYENNDTVGKPLYLSYSSSGVSVTTDRENYTKFTFESIADWTRFGDAYMQQCNWINRTCNDVNLLRAINNYENNKSIGIDTTNNLTPVNNYNLLFYQNGGNFPKMKFNSAIMSNVCCEIMATYNALALTGEFDIINNSGVMTNDVNEFFELALEFELNAQYLDYIPSGGRFGSDPEKIEDCLISYNKQYQLYTNVDDMDNNMTNSVSAIVSYNFYVFGIHTYCCYYDNQAGKIKSINRENNNTHVLGTNSIKNCLGDYDFNIGYILK